MSSNHESRGVIKNIIEVIKANEDKKVKWSGQLNNKLIVFTYYLKLPLTWSHIIKLFYWAYLIYLMT